MNIQILLWFTWYWAGCLFSNTGQGVRGWFRDFFFSRTIRSIFITFQDYLFKEFKIFKECANVTLIHEWNIYATQTLPLSWGKAARTLSTAYLTCSLLVISRVKVISRLDVISRNLLCADSVKHVAKTLKPNISSLCTNNWPKPESQPVTKTYFSLYLSTRM